MIQPNIMCSSVWIWDDVSGKWSVIQTESITVYGHWPGTTCTCVKEMNNLLCEVLFIQ